MIGEGTQLARGVTLIWAESSQKKTPLAAVTFRIEQEGPDKGSLIEFEGYMSENAQARTIESLEACGWDGERDETIGINQVNLVIEREEQADKVGKKTGRMVVRVRFVTRLDRVGGRFAPADAARAMQLKQQAKGLLLQFKASQPAQPQNSGASFQHGANAPPSTGQSAPGGPKF
jgi:hypothetical protein